MRSPAGMDHSADRSRYFFAVAGDRCDRMILDGMGVRQHLAGQAVSDSRALLGGVSLDVGKWGENVRDESLKTAVAIAVT